MQQVIKQAQVQLTSTELHNLTKEVKETIFHQPSSASTARFTGQDLWRIQRLKRPVVIRRAFSL
jgi:hypothetical protein